MERSASGLALCFKMPLHFPEAQSIIHRTRWVVNTVGEKIFVSSSSPRPFFRIITLAHRRVCCNRGKSCYNNVRCATRNTAAQKEGRPEFAAISCWDPYAGPVHFTARKLRRWRRLSQRRFCRLCIVKNGRHWRFTSPLGLQLCDGICQSRVGLANSPRRGFPPQVAREHVSHPYLCKTA